MLSKGQHPFVHSGLQCTQAGFYRGFNSKFWFLVNKALKADWNLHKFRSDAVFKAVFGELRAYCCRWGGVWRISLIVWSCGFLAGRQGAAGRGRQERILKGVDGWMEASLVFGVERVRGCEGSGLEWV